MELIERPRRLRQNASIRDMIRESSLRPEQLFYPFFVCEGKNKKLKHKSVPGIQTASVDQIVSLLKPYWNLGIRAFVLFGVSSKKDARGSRALDKKGPVVQAIRQIRSKFPEAIVATDIALDPYTDHGHDGIFEKGEILNDASVEVLCEMSILHAEAGAHILSPSDMMDGRCGAIRLALDASGFENNLIMSYTAKYASALYGPFRDTLDVNLVGDKKTYQMDPANRREALRELQLDLQESADIVMVKPATWYLDIISDFKQSSSVPVAAYHVSGEAALLELGAKAGLFDRDRAILESLLSIRRAGADLILSYQALDVARIIS